MAAARSARRSPQVWRWARSDNASDAETTATAGLDAHRATVPINGGTMRAGGHDTIAVEKDLPPSEEGVLALLYSRGGRPSIEDVRRASVASGAFALTFEPGEHAGWAEMLITGLTFDVSGLAPGKAHPVPLIAHRFGLDGGWSSNTLEALVLRPGEHLAGAAAMLPVVRGCVALAAALAHETGAAAVVWIPARSAMSTDYFGSVVADWLGGGAFPALGLTALVPNATGIASEGLQFFTGQELEVISAPGSDPAQTGRVAVRMVHLLASNGPLAAPTRLTGPDGEPLLAEPVKGGSRVCARALG